MKPNLYFLSVFFLLFLFSCGKDDNPQKEADDDHPVIISPRAGQWTGIYGAGKYGLSFIVNEAGNIQNFTVTIRAGGIGCGVTIVDEATFLRPDTTAVDSSFSFNAVINISGLYVNNEFTGKFDNDEEASGTFDSNFTIFTSSTLCFGSSSGISWSAKKDCSLKPEEGESSTRFCD